MAKFDYRATDDQGRELRGEIEAADVLEAATLLRARGVAALSLDRAEPEAAVRSMEEPDAFAFFNRALGEMARLGFPMSRAVREISTGLRRGRFKSALGQVEAGLREGKSLEAAVSARPSDFPPYYRWMLEAGTASGDLPTVLSAVARNAEGFRRARRALLDALTYPAVILLVAALLVTGFVFVFGPVFRDLYLEQGFEPPLIVRVVLDVAGSVALQGGALCAAIALGISVYYFLRRTVAGERFLLRLPLMGRIHRDLWIARMMGTLGTLLRAQMPLSRALPVAIGASGSLELNRACERLRAKAAEGTSLGDLLKEAPVVPPAVAAYVALSEKSGAASRGSQEAADLLTERAMAGGELLFVILFPVALLLSGAVMAILFVSLVTPYIGFLEGLNKG